MADSVAGLSRTIERLVGQVEAKTVFGTASYYLASTLVFFVIIQFLNEKKHFLSKLLSGRRRKTSGNNNNTKTKGKDDDKYVAGLEAVPGPRSLPVVGNALDIAPMSRVIDVTFKWSKEYGPCFKFHGPWNEPIVILNSGPLIQSLLKSTDLGHGVKMPLAYDLMRPFITNGVLVSKGKFWQHERKILLRSQSFQSLRAYITMLNNHCERFVTSLDKLFADGEVHTINELINSSFLEVICEMITGFDIHNTTEGVEYHHSFQIWKETIAYRLLYPWNIPNFIFQFNPLCRKNEKAIKVLFDFARRRITEHKKKRADAAATKKETEVGGDVQAEEDKTSSTPTPSFRSVLDELLDAGVSDDQIIDEVNTMLFGGHETGASTIHFFCLSMALNPEIQELCRKEVDEVFDDQLQDGKMTYDCLPNLKYLERTIQETLRLYPPVLIFLRQLKTPLRIELDNQPIDLPPGTNIGIYPFLLHRQAEYFPDPERFDPDRFLPENISERHTYTYVPFSHGPRNCLGLKFAMIEMKMVAAYLLRNFVMLTTDKLEDVKLLPNLTLTPERDYNFIFKKRTLS